MAKYIDLRMTDDDLEMSGTRQAVLLSDRDSIGQDLKHMIRESGLLVAMVGERDSERRGLLLQKLMTLVEDDTRVVPGTVRVSDDGTLKHWTLRAETYEFGPLSETVEVD